LHYLCPKSENITTKDPIFYFFVQNALKDHLPPLKKVQPPLVNQTLNPPTNPNQLQYTIKLFFPPTTWDIAFNRWWIKMSALHTSLYHTYKLK